MVGKSKQALREERVLEYQKKYLEALEETGSNKLAAEKAGVRLEAAYGWAKANTSFAERLEKTKWLLVQEVEWSLFSVALEKSSCNPVQLKAKLSILKAYKPEKYGDKVIMEGGDESKPIYVKGFMIKEIEPHGSGR